MRQKKYYKLIRVDYEDSEYLRLKNVSNEAGIFKMVKIAPSWTSWPDLEYSLDGVNWTTYDFTTLPEVTVAAGTNVYLRGNNTNGFEGINQWNGTIKISFDKTCEAHGNICSLLKKDPTQFPTITSLPTWCFVGLFSDLTTLTVAPNIGNVTDITYTSLLKAFSGCTSLTTPPDFSNVTSVGNFGLQYCFNGCTSLTTAPDFSNLTSVGSEGLRYVFQNCTSLVTAPDLSSVTSIGSSGLSYAFNGCSKLSTATAPNISDLTADNVLQNWLQNAGTQATGTKTVNVPTGATITANSTSGIPTGWTRVDY